MPRGLFPKRRAAAGSPHVDFCYRAAAGADRPAPGGRWEQRHLVEQFATGPPQQRFEGVPHTFHLGQPLIVSAPVRLVCTVEAAREAWDHALLTGRVAWCSHHPESAGLLLHGRGRHPVPHHAAG
ncbi:flavin reductase family protein [Streptomyces decoyicus]|nr:flavin reductase family protein [Streptomyces decoyicus]